MEKEFPIPPFFWSVLCQRSNGYFGCQDITDEAGSLSSHHSWFRFQIKQLTDGPRPYVWYDLTFFGSWHPDKCRILCFDINPLLRTQIQIGLTDGLPNLPSDIYFLQATLVGLVLEMFDRSVWALRDCVREIEKTRMGRTEPRTDYPKLHEVARHACHSSETLAVAIDTVHAMHNQYRNFLHSSKSDHRLPCSTRTSQYFSFQKQLFRGLHARSMAVEARLKNELNLAINMVAQEASAATVLISQATQHDGAAMKSVAVITLVFLPSTFISTIFSMSFFAFEPGGDGRPESWKVSQRIWLYFLLVVPLTTAAMGTWFWWQRRSSWR